MDDRTLLELAARAAGMDGQYSAYPGMEARHGYEFALYVDGHGYWNPLTDDGDAFRLAVKLNIDVLFGANYVTARGHVAPMPTINADGDLCAATRRCIVRAAAAIGEGMG